MSYPLSSLLQVWTCSNTWHHVSPIIADAESLNDCIFSLLRTLDGDQIANVASVLWCLWQRRNDNVWNNVEKPPQLSLNMATGYIRQSQVACKHFHSSTTTRALPNNTIPRWMKPELGFIKCNVDASISSEARQFMLGGCICNSNGEFMLARTSFSHGNIPAAEAEASSFLAAAHWVSQMGLTHVIFKLDCTQLYDSLRSNRHKNSK
ncbi:hypothetical protein glysoja_039082 [Glycine soja]|uniref:RNase H type-1 domain-containing protein n=1 Tax=Glycine soja TaxID=3848 RepID=A0A0B2SFQ1_GLYSO|nr:hypothetical protein glysoja_039082 [Glycine soja]